MKSTEYAHEDEPLVFVPNEEHPANTKVQQDQEDLDEDDR